ncbi:hypothetical protein F2P81_024375 [Scophthalmus maximus]|uniref:Uncharacterized protein n=1 Tax=Scophthalmus maximus TaxID=52904 RepID=A0A6A4RU36_SCOMX|nr:hypothetical protein F2P81_024375 [Scophthalmus maximus]
MMVMEECATTYGASRDDRDAQLQTGQSATMSLSPNDKLHQSKKKQPLSDAEKSRPSDFVAFNLTSDRCRRDILLHRAIKTHLSTVKLPQEQRDYFHDCTIIVGIVLINVNKRPNRAESNESSDVRGQTGALLIIDCKGLDLFRLNYKDTSWSETFDEGNEVTKISHRVHVVCSSKKHKPLHNSRHVSLAPDNRDEADGDQGSRSFHLQTAGDSTAERGVRSVSNKEPAD